MSSKAELMKKLATVVADLGAKQAEKGVYQVIKANLTNASTKVTYVLDGADFENDYSLAGFPYDQAKSDELTALKNLQRDFRTVQETVEEQLQSKINQLELEVSDLTEDMNHLTEAINHAKE